MMLCLIGSDKPEGVLGLRHASCVVSSSVNFCCLVPAFTKDPSPDLACMTQIWFETFSVPAMYMATQTVPFVSGHTTDLVMDAGDGVPIYEGYTLRHDILRLSVRDLSEYLMMNPTEQEYSLTRWIARDIIENLCYLVVDYDTELKSTDKEKTREFSDGNITWRGYSFSATAERD